MDFSMPMMNGDRATAEIMEFQRRQGLSLTDIVGLTANTDDAIKQQCLKSGQKAVYEKPVTLPKLKQMLLLYHFKLDQSQY